MKNAYRPHCTALLAIAATLALVPALAPAQAIYRIVGPDGRVTFSDKPPASNEKATALSPSGKSSEGPAGGDIPFELRQLMSRYPVTLYTGDDCAPCAAARTLLATRGVPYTEKTVKTPMDVQALQEISGGSTVPVLTIGGQRLKGFLNSEWNQYLDAAGYSSALRLPPSYRNPSPTPLVALPQAPAATTQPASQPAPPPESAPFPPPPNPSGIVF